MARLPAGYRNYKEDPHRTQTTEDLKAVKDLIAHFRDALSTERDLDKARADIRFHTTRYTQIKGEVSEHTKVLIAYTPHVRKCYGTLPRLINYSCLLQIYSVFEERGRRVCEELKKRNKRITISLGEIKRQADFHAIRLFLEKVAKIKYNFWGDLELLEQLRHRIIHHHGSTKDEKLIARIEKTKGLFWTDGRILVGDAYIDKMLERVTSLFEEIFRQKRFGDASVFIPLSSDSDEAEIATKKVDGRTMVTIHGWETSALDSVTKK